ncbi:hypothetical protein MRB53_010366 [Persea americana]|uniref:Uncharacterized protein n=1 Tax=Persea americana TaxID=3435 RepID=A0ACC2LRL7_PERAE|nr:hypothetical protein MRB53_010366 [Persea americana]
MNKDFGFEEVSLDGGEKGFHVERRDFRLASKKGRRKVMEDGNGFIFVVFEDSKQSLSVWGPPRPISALSATRSHRSRKPATGTNRSPPTSQKVSAQTKQSSLTGTSPIHTSVSPNDSCTSLRSADADTCPSRTG